MSDEIYSAEDIRKKKFSIQHIVNQRIIQGANKFSKKRYKKIWKLEIEYLPLHPL
jgi:hypothetical protein